MVLKSVLLAIVTVVFNSAGQLLLRAAALRGATAASPMTLLKSPLFIAAISTYTISVLTWLAVLKKLPLTVAMPLVALTYILVPVAAKFIFNDELTWRMVLGMLLIATGIVIVAAK